MRSEHYFIITESITKIITGRSPHAFGGMKLLHEELPGTKHRIWLP